MTSSGLLKEQPYLIPLLFNPLSIPVTTAMSDVDVWTRESFLLFVNSSSKAAALALFAYDYLLTVGDEIQYIWPDRLTLVKTLFFINRYVGIVNIPVDILTTVPFRNKTDTSCVYLERTQMIFNVLMSASLAIFFAIRTHAMYSHTRWVFMITLVLGLSSSIITAYIFSDLIPVNFEQSDWPFVHTPYWMSYCSFGTNHWTIQQFLFWMAGARIASILADTVVLVFTLRKALESRRLAGKTVSMQSLSMMDFVVRHGALYFLVALLLNLAGFIVCLSNPDPTIENIMLVWISIITSILMSRFIISLKANYSTPDPNDKTIGDFDTHGFFITTATMYGTVDQSSGPRGCIGCKEHHPMDSDAYCYDMRVRTPLDIDVEMS